MSRANVRGVYSRNNILIEGSYSVKFENAPELACLAGKLHAVKGRWFSPIDGPDFSILERLTL